jgi:YjbE family integral membrane protein
VHDPAHGLDGRFMQYLGDAAFWITLGKIAWVNVLLSGDNAVVIALAAHGLPPDQRRQAIFGGSGAAIVLRVLLTWFAATLLDYPYLKIVGALLLFYIGVKLLVAEDEHDAGIQSHDHLWAAIRTILLADLVMSLDNVLAVAGAAESGPPGLKLPLLVIGLGLSIPLIIFGSTLLLRVMERYPVIITVGAALLGYVAGEMLVSDAAIEPWFTAHAATSSTVIEIGAAVAVVLLGQRLARRKHARATAAR